MSNEKIIKIPITYDQRKFNKYGQGYVPCQVSSRWLQFSDTIDKNLGFIFVDVMTENSEGQSHKLCQLCLKYDDIVKALQNVKIIDNKKNK